MKTHTIALAIASLLLSTASHAEGSKLKHTKWDGIAKCRTQDTSQLHTQACNSLNRYERGDETPHPLIERMPAQPGSVY